MRDFIRARLFILLAGLVILLIIVPTTVISIHARTTQAVASSALTKVHHAPTGPYIPSVSSKSAPADWPEFHANAARDGNHGTDTRLSKANASSLVPVSGPGFTNTGAAMSSPAVYQGILYYAANMPVTSGNKTLHISTMYAVNAKTGIIVWSKPFPHCPNVTKSEYVFSSSAVITGLINGVATQEVFIGWGPITSKTGCLYDFNGRTGVLGPWLPGTATRGDLLALDPASGAVLADYPIANHAYGAVSSPAVYGNTIFVTEGYSIYSNPAPVGGVLAAFQCTGC